MNRYHIVKEYIDFYLFRRRLTRDEFCKICEIPKEELFKIENNNGYNLDILKIISEYINVPMNLLYVDLDSDNFKKIIDDYDLENIKTANTSFIPF